MNKRVFWAVSALVVEVVASPMGRATALNANAAAVSTHVATADTRAITAAAATATAVDCSAHESGDITRGMSLQVDVTDTVHKLLSVHEVLAVSPGPLTLAYPEWIPGHHRPDGKVENVAGLFFRAGGKTLDWRRDAHDPFLFHVDIPRGVSQLEIEFQYLPGLSMASGTATSSLQMVRVDFETAVLYPLVPDILNLPVAASVRVPRGWKTVTALDAEDECDNLIRYRTASLETVVDSPLVSGAYLQRYELFRDGGQPVFLDMFAETEAAAKVPDSFLARHRQAFQSVARYFGSQPYAHYDFLIPLSSRLTPYGVEHQQSTEASMSPAYFTDPDQGITLANMLVHEYAHTWNGKWRRPAGLATSNYNTPMQGDLLWVYEGLTSYFDRILTVRGGLWTASQGRDVFAENAATFAHRAGAAWRSLQDTTITAITRSSDAWTDWERDQDYYDASALLWLEVDTQIRSLSRGKRSLDDFVRSFLGGDDRNRSTRTYTFEDLVVALNAVQPFDWAKLLRARLDARGAEAFAMIPESLRLSGYRLVYSSEPSQWTTLRQASGKTSYLQYSLGAQVAEDGSVQSVLWDSPAFQAGLLAGHASEDKILEVNGKPYTADVLRAAVAATSDSRSAAATNRITLKVDGPDGKRTLTVNYGGGLQYPHLQRVPGTRAILDEILGGK